MNIYNKHPEPPLRLSPWVPLPILVDVEDIPTFIVPEISNLHLNAAQKINKAIFHMRLGYVDDVLSWWSGREWQFMPEETLRRYIWKSLPEKYDRLAFVKGVIAAIKTIAPRIKSLPTNGLVFFRNLVFDCDLNKIQPHAREHCNRSTFSHDYDPAAKNLVKWETFLASVFGNINNDRILLLQEFFGWCMITHNIGLEQCAALVGVPRAGKGTILKTLHAMLGASCTTVNFDRLGSPRSHASMRAHNVVIDFDAKEPNKLHFEETKSTFVKVTSNDPISSNKFYSTKSISGPMNCKLIIACNKIPNFDDTTGAIAARFQPLMFDKSFLGKERAGIFEDLLIELPSILMWSFAGLIRLANSGPSEPKSSKEIQEDLMYNSNVLNGFVDEHVLIIPGEKCFMHVLYGTYELYSKEKNLKTMSILEFHEQMKSTLLGKNVIWTSIMIDNQQGKGAVGLRLVNPLRIKVGS